MIDTAKITIVHKQVGAAEMEVFRPKDIKELAEFLAFKFTHEQKEEFKKTFC